MDARESANFASAWKAKRLVFAGFLHPLRELEQENDGGYNRETFIQEEEIIIRNWKKLKTKNFSKITTYVR